MNIIVPVKLVPDLVEELSIDASGTALDTAWLRMIINEFDDHAIEQAILLKERRGAHVTSLSMNIEGVYDLLFTAAAKGADRLIKLTGDFESGMNNHALARAMATILRDLKPDLILTGIQAAEQPPRYVAISKVRQMMKTMSIEELDLATLDSKGAPVVNRMFQPEATERAMMLSENADDAANQLVTIFKE